MSNDYQPPPGWGPPQQYPPSGQFPPPGPPGRRRTGLIVLVGLVVAAVLVGGAVFGVTQLRGDDGDTGARGTVPSSAPSSMPSSAPSPVPSSAGSTGPDWPSSGPSTPSAKATGVVPCDADDGYTKCFPAITVSGTVAQFRARHAGCGTDGTGWVCDKGGDVDSSITHIGDDLIRKTKVRSFSFTMFSRREGNNARGKTDVSRGLNRSMPVLGKIFFPTDPETARQITTWLRAHVANCPASDVLIRTYYVRCTSPGAIQVADKKTFTTWSATVLVDTMD